MKLGIFGGVATRAYADKMLRDAEATLNIVAGEKPHVIIAWPLAPLDGHSGVVEGKNEQGRTLVRLDATGGVFAVPGEFLVAAPKTKEKKSAEEKGAEARKPDPGSRGSAPEEKELGKKAKESVTPVVEPPAKLERKKPQALPIEEARTAPEAGSPIETLVNKTLSIETEKAAAVSKLNKFEEGLNLELIDENYKKTVKELHDAIEATGEPVLKLKDQLLAIDVKRDVVEANMSEETRKKFNALVEKLSTKEAEMARLNEQIEELVNASFARMGGTEKQEQRVTMFKDPKAKTKATASLIEVLSILRPGASHDLTAQQLTRLQRLEAGLKEMFKAIVDKAKEFASGIGELVGLGNDFVNSYERDAKAVAGAEPVAAAAKTDNRANKNTDRAKAGKAALDGWSKSGSLDPHDPQSNLVDMLADVLHYADSIGMDGAAAMSTAQGHYDAEKAGGSDSDEDLPPVNSSLVNANIGRLPSGKWKDTNGNSYDTFEEAVEAEAHGHVDPKLDPNSEEYKTAHEAAAEEIMQQFRASKVKAYSPEHVSPENRPWLEACVLEAKSILKEMGPSMTEKINAAGQKIRKQFPNAPEYAAQGVLEELIAELQKSV